MRAAKCEVYIEHCNNREGKCCKKLNVYEVEPGHSESHRKDVFTAAEF